MPIKTSLSRLSKNPLIWSLISLAFLCAYLLFLLNKTPEEKPLIAELALTQSIIRGDLVAAQTLLTDENNEEDIHETDALGRTALHIAAFYGQTEIAAFLLEKGIAIENAKDAAPDIKVINEEYRSVNGVQVLMMQMSGTIRGMRFTYYGYYYSNSNGTIQLLTYTGENLFPNYLNDIEEFLNGLVEN